MRRLFLIIATLLWAFYSGAQALPELIPFRSGTLWGYADTTGKVVLKPRWSEAFFFRNGRAVVRTETEHGSSFCSIDRKGRYIIPPERRWTGVSSRCEILLNCVNKDGLYGRVDSNNNLLLPYQWKTPEAINTENYSFNFHDNLIDTEQYLKPALERKWGPYILFKEDAYSRYGLMDARRNIKIPAGEVYWINGDTLITRKKVLHEAVDVTHLLTSLRKAGKTNVLVGDDMAGMQSFFTLTDTRWSLASLTPMDSTTQIFAMGPVPKTYHVGFCGVEPISPSPIRPEYSPVIKTDDFRIFGIDGFSKDSFYFSVKKCVADRPCRKIYEDYSWDPTKRDKSWYGCIGRLLGGNCDRVYGAVVDRDFNYVVKPMEGLEIMGYNPGEDIIAVKAANNTYGLISSRGDTLMSFSNLELTGGYRWRGKVYAYTISREQFPGLLPGITREVYQVTDSAGRISQRWAAYHNSERLEKEVQMSRGAPGIEDYFITYDSSENVVVLDSGGQKILPALCGRYSTLRRVGQHYFWACGEWIGSGKLVDRNNVEVFPGINIRAVDPVGIGYGVPDISILSKQLYTVRGSFSGPGESPFCFYMDLHGVAYTADLRKK